MSTMFAFCNEKKGYSRTQATKHFNAYMTSEYVSSLTVGTKEDTVGVFSGQAFWLQGEPQEQ